ncbi:hypothetical protein CO662_23280 [Rhizobium anhuiense]|uniref:Uncharacterized protein n=1 Tax=Rhizobium anhuiense TaxID=1184720 RepID=A0ABX4J2W2_9HYPH|nr:hypothetical protein CO668_29215 [Rhizobium anhuiense]PDS49528.1 hypothetical protein CO662_23280 [Rhizobium anhuiense]
MERPSRALATSHAAFSNDEAAGFAAALGHPVEAVVVPRDGWDATFRAQGMQNPQGRIRMLDGFNEGWITSSGRE